MTIPQTIGLAVVILIGICAILCYATLWAEPRKDDPIEKIDVERL